jgi:hypothetical protein
MYFAFDIDLILVLMKIRKKSEEHSSPTFPRRQIFDFPAYLLRFSWHRP